MKKKIIIAGIAVFVLLVVAPVIVKQLMPVESRTYEAVSLDELRYEEIQFRNDEQDLNLAGMLFMPEGDGPFPAVVFIHGSGNSRRDNKWYCTMVDTMVSNGVAALLPDKRGCVESEGNWRTSSFEDLATDTIAAVEYLRANHADTITEIGVLGASQGGQIAPIAAAQSEEVAFAIDLVGAPVPFHKSLVYEETHNLRQMGLLPGVSDGIAALSSIYIRKVAQPEFWNAVGNYDALPYWEKVDVPALVLLGGDDTNTHTRMGVERFKTLDKANIDVIVFDGSGHALQDPAGRGNDYIRHEARDAMASFVHRVTSDS